MNNALGAQLETSGYALQPLGEPLTEQVRQLFLTADDFFALPLVAKKQCHNKRYLIGFRDVGIEFSKSPDRPDLMEAYSVSLGLSEVGRDFQYGRDFHAKMLSVARLFDDWVDRLSLELIEYFAPSRDKELFFQCDSGSFLQLNYYDMAKHQRDLLQDDHEDGNYLTLIHYDQPGLEISLDGREFFPAQLPEGHVLIMPGEVLSLLTGGCVRPLYHRVRAYKEVHKRKSVMYFANPSIEQPISPWLRNDFNADVDILARAVRNSGIFGLPMLNSR